MSSELPLPPRRGRRDNGLDAATYIPLADVDPRIGEHLLDVLRLAGVPAYLEPSADVEPYTRALALPSPPTDRLWVDREQRVAARQIVETEVGNPRPRIPEIPGDDRPSRGLTDAEEEQAWQRIVAGFAAEPDVTVPPWPVVEDIPDGNEDEDHRPAPAAGGSGPDRRDLAGVDGWRRQDGLLDHLDQPDPPGPPEDEEEHYVPPPPPPIPRLSKQAVIAIILLGTGGLMVVAPTLLGFDETSGKSFGVVAIVIAAVLLVWRLGERRSDDGPDDGAVV